MRNCIILFENFPNSNDIWSNNKMKRSLLLGSSLIFDDPDIIDCIRQTCVGLKNSPETEEIKIFFKRIIEIS